MKKSILHENVIATVFSSASAACMLAALVLTLAGVGETGSAGRGFIAAPLAVGFICAVAGIMLFLRGGKKQSEYIENRIKEEKDRAEGEKILMRENFKEFRSKLRGRVSHSLRMPISIISGYSDIVVSNMVAGEERNKIIKKISTEVKELNTVLSDIILEIEGGEAEAEERREVINFSELVTQLADDVKHIANSLNIEITVAKESENISAYASRPQIKRLIHNLLENSFNYMSRPGRINLNLSYLGDNSIMLIVRDDGVGMDQEKADMVFDSHFTTDCSSGHQGYGLYMCRNIVVAHGGTIEIKTGIEKGMTTVIVLPITG